MNSKEHDLLVVFTFLFLKSPWIFLQEGINSLLQSMVRVDSPIYFFASDGLNWSFYLVMLLQDFSFISKALLGNNRIFHKHQGDFTDQVIRYFMGFCYKCFLLCQSFYDLYQLFFTFLYFSSGNSSLSSAFFNNFFYTEIYFNSFYLLLYHITFFKRNIFIEIYSSQSLVDLVRHSLSAFFRRFSALLSLVSSILPISAKRQPQI